MEMKRNCYHFLAVAKTSSVNLDNVDVIFNSLTLKNEDEDIITIEDRDYAITKERCSEGILLHVFVVNDGDSLNDRIDWLLDEEYLIDSVDIEATKISTGEKLEVEFKDYGEEIEHSIKVNVSPDLEKSVEFMKDRLTDGNFALEPLIVQTLSNDGTFAKFIADIATLDIL